MVRGAAVVVALLLLVMVAAPRSQAAVPKASARAMKCFEVGVVYGQQFALMDPAQRARGDVFRNYCANVADNTLRRVPTDADVDTIIKEIQGVRRSAESDARLNTSPLNNQLRDGQNAESNMLNELLK
jgi:hypothetical protein